MNDLTEAEGTSAPKPESTKHLRTLSNGAVYDTRIGRIVNGKGITTKITEENSIAYHSQRAELKRAALMRAANAVANQGGTVDGRALQGDYAFVEAIGEAMTMKALTVNDPKAVDAARFLFKEIGISEEKQDPVTSALSATADVLRELTAFAQQVNLHDTHEGAIDPD